MKSTIQEIRSELEINVDEKTKQSYQRFFKKQVKYYGVKTGIVGKIAKKYWQAVKKLNKKEIFSLCEMLYASDYCEETFIVSFWIPNLTDQFELTDILTFERWIKKYINNWAKCDSFCNHSVGNFIEKYPELIKELKK